jgi:hypothetical protein
VLYQRDHRYKHLPYSVGHYEGDVLVIDTLGMNANSRRYFRRRLRALRRGGSGSSTMGGKWSGTHRGRSTMFVRMGMVLYNRSMFWASTKFARRTIGCPMGYEIPTEKTDFLMRRNARILNDRPTLFPNTW